MGGADRGAETARAILIAGPTASGKSALATVVAGACGGTVINADSMQVYADIPILSAQPGPDDRARVPHALFGHLDAAEPHSVGRWLAAIEAALGAAREAGRRPVIVGGTGLYFKALTQGLSAMPDVPAALRATLRAEAEGVDPAVLHGRLAGLDPLAAARLRPSDPQRILRALEVVLATGRSITAFQTLRAPALLPPGRTHAFFLQPERDALKRRIALRFAAMMAAGALDEVATLARRGPRPRPAGHAGAGGAAPAGPPRWRLRPVRRRDDGDARHLGLCAPPVHLWAAPAARFRNRRTGEGRTSGAGRPGHGALKRPRAGHGSVGTLVAASRIIWRSSRARRR